MWALSEKESGVLIGRAGLLQFTLHSEPMVDFSYLLDRPFWSRGYATEAAAETVKFAFDKVRVNRLFAFIDPENAASARIAQRLGKRSR